MNALDDWNQTAFLFINGSDQAPAWLVNTAQAMTTQVMLLVPLVLLVLWLSGRHAYRNRVLKALLVGVLGLGLAHIIHSLWPHPRPFMLGLGHQWLPHGPEASFPSNHLTFLFGISLSLLFDGLLLSGAVTGTVALGVAWARVYLGVHFPLDMLGALCVALLCYGAVSPAWECWASQLTFKRHHRAPTRPIRPV